MTLHPALARLKRVPRPSGASAFLPDDVAHSRLVRPSCKQLFFVYAGAGGQMTVDPSTFLRVTRLLDRNLVLLRDGRFI